MLSGGCRHPPQIDLAERLAAGKMRAVNREVTALQGTRGIHLSEREGTGIAWIEGSEFAQGTIELDVRGRDVSSRASSASRSKDG